MIDISRSLFPGLKRALRLRGSIPLSLDGTIVPIVQVADIDELPYLDDPTFAFALNVPAVVAEFAAFVMQPPPGFYLVLDRWRVASTGGIANVALNVAGGTYVATANLPARTVRQRLWSLPLGNPLGVVIAPGTFLGGTTGNAFSGVLHMDWFGCVSGSQPGPWSWGPWVCDEQTQLVIQSLNANVEVTCSMQGRILPRA